MNGRVDVVGSINVDLVVRLARLPARGETVTGGQFARHFGGKGANQAVAAARLGSPVTLVASVGDDAFGREALADLVTEKVDVSHVTPLPGVPTGVALITVGERGENQIAVAPGANALLDGVAVASALATATDHALLLANFEVPDNAVLAGAHAAAERGWPIVINPAPARELPTELLALGPILVPNEVEARTLTGATDVDEAAGALHALTGAAVIITLGESGVLVLDPPAPPKHVRAPRVQAVDTTGAGDAFVGALAAELARGMSLEAAARFAVAAAALSVTVAGARGGMPTRASVERELANS